VIENERFLRVLFVKEKEYPRNPRETVKCSKKAERDIKRIYPDLV
jgi:hypothetical protein